MLDPAWLPAPAWRRSRTGCRRSKWRCSTSASCARWSRRKYAASPPPASVQATTAPRKVVTAEKRFCFRASTCRASVCADLSIGAAVHDSSVARCARSRRSRSGAARSTRSSSQNWLRCTRSMAVDSGTGRTAASGTRCSTRRCAAVPRACLCVPTPCFSRMRSSFFTRVRWAR